MIDELKNIASNILSDEIKKYSLETKFYVLTNREFDKYRKEFNMKKNENDSFYHEKSDTIYIIIDESSSLEYNDLFDLVFKCFHEVRHAFQKKFSITSYEGFFNHIDDINSCDNFDYDVVSHNAYSYEIGANLYGIEQTKKYMFNNFNSYFKMYEEKMNLIERICKSEYLVFNAASRFSIFMYNLKFYMKLGLVRWSDQKQVREDDVVLSDIMNVFINRDGSFKKINEIVNSEYFSKLDKRIIYAIFSSDVFLKNISIDGLSSEIISILEESLKYTSELNKKQASWKNDLYDSKRALYNYEITNSNSVLSKIYNIGTLYKDLLFYDIRFNSYYRKDNDFYKHIVLKQIEELKLQNGVKIIR